MIITAAELRRDVETYLKAALPTALQALGGWLGTDGAPFPMPVPRTWERLPSFETIAERQSPAVVVTTPGLTPGRRDGDGDYTVRGVVAVFAVVRGRDYHETADRVAGYVAAIRLALLNDPAAVGATGVVWTEEAYDELAADRDRTIGAGRVTVAYDLAAPGTFDALPADLLPPDDRAPTALTTDVDVELLKETP